jgi:glycosyltransferase involved in cell wall biosynthesis
LETRPEVHLLQADGAPAFARAVLRVLNDPSLRRNLGQAGREYVEAHHDWDRAATQLERIYASLAAP